MSLFSIDPFDRSVTEALRAWHAQHEAGVSVPQAFLSCATIPPAARVRACFEEAAARASTGQPIEGLLEALSPCLGEAERMVIAAGWKSGRAGPVLAAVVAQRELWGEARRRIRRGLALPAFVLFAAAFVAPLPAFIASETMTPVGYLARALTPISIAVLAFCFFWRLLNARARAPVTGGPEGAPAPAGFLSRFILALPMVGSVERQRNLSEFATLLGQVVGAGVGVTEGLDLCARTLSNGVYRQEVGRAAIEVRRGRALHEVLQAGRLWPAEFVAILRVGDESGSLPESLVRLGRYARERYEAAVTAFADWLPRIIYALVCLFIIYNIFRMVVGQIGPAYQGLFR